MELGIGMFGDNHYNAKGQPLDAGQRLRELIEEIKLMDQVGLDFFGLGEHHRPDYAVSVPDIVLAAAATVTKNIKLGSAVTVLSSADPVKVYQNFATIDQISSGRAEITAGRGSFIESFPIYGYDLNQYNELFDEKLNLLHQINTTNPITWKGKLRAPLNNQEILPRAFDQLLKIWVAVGGTPESVVRAAQYGMPVIFAIIGGDPKNFIPLFNYYKEAYQHFKFPIDKYEVGVHMHAFFGDDQVVEDYYPVYAQQMDRIGASRGWPKYQRQSYDQGKSKDGHLVIGNVQESIEKILKMKEYFGLTRFSAHIDVGGPSHEMVMKTIEIFGDKIAPAIRKYS